MKKTILSGMLLIVSFAFPVMLEAVSPQTAGQALPGVRTYDQLVAAIRKARVASKSRVEQAVRQEKVRECWETGKLIDEHVLRHKERADYGEQVIIKLAKDLGTSETELKYMLQFARTYPIRRPADELSWSHYESLLAVNDPKEREALTEQAIKEKWTRQRTREEVRKRRLKDSKPEEKIELPPVQPGKPHTYRIVPGLKTGEVAIDLGFSIYYTPPEISLKAFKAGDIVRGGQAPFSQGLAPFPQEKVPVPFKNENGASPLYTYSAIVTEVIDGDTIWAVLDLGFGMRTKLRLRLNHIDAPEIVSAEGKESKAFLEELIRKSSGTVTVKSSRLDNYGRYLIDLWAGETYANQALLDNGFATRMEE